MTWLLKYRVGLYFRNSIWILPSISMPLGLVSVALLFRVDRALGWEVNMGIETARTIMGVIAGSIFSLLVLITSAVLVAVQLSAGQLTPRIIALVYRNPFRKLALSIFAFTFTFSVGALARLENSVPVLTVYVAACGFLLNMALFLLFIDNIGKTLRPSSVLRTVALIGRHVIRTVYPSSLDQNTIAPVEQVNVIKNGRPRVVLNANDGVVLAFDLMGLVSLATRSKCLIELVPAVGSFVASGAPLFRIYGGGESLSDDLLLQSVALGQERTMEQDPMFAFRIMVDIASRALSPAVNDPTTAVLAIDQIHNLLRDIGTRSLAEGRERDASGTVRLVYRTPNWEDFVYLAVTEIRQYGHDSIQVMRRLRAMLDDLVEVLPEKRVSLLRRELALLQASTRRTFPDAEDQQLAELSDLLGMGGNLEESDKVESEPWKAETAKASNIPA